MEKLHYEDFELKIQREGDSYTARILRSPAGEVSGIFTLPFSDDRLELLVLRIGGHLRTPTRRKHSVEMEAARELGGKLFETVFSGDIRARFKSSLDIVYGKKKTGLRLKLRLQDVPELAEIPWEFLYDASLNRFLIQSNQTPIIRYLEIPEKTKPLKMNLPLCVLVITSSPHDYCSLGVECERSSLEKALRPLIDKGQVSVKWLESPTLSEIHHCLCDGEYHIFHFIGHGGFDKKTQEGVLVLEDEQGNGCFTGAHKISTLLHNHPSLRLVVLNSCEGARNSRTDPFAGVAAELIRQRIPAVVAMQFEITDSAAITFSGEFYSAISKGFPVDAAVSEARIGIYASSNEIEWGTPVLYMRSPDGVLFEIKGIQPVVDLTGSKKGTTKTEDPQRDIVVHPQAGSDPPVLADGTITSGQGAEPAGGKTSAEPAAGLLNRFAGSIVNAPRSVKIAGILMMAIAGLLFLGLPGIISDQPPSLSVSPDSILFNLDNMSTGETAVRTFSISNAGQGTLKWNVSADQPWITVNPVNGSDSGTVIISINTTGLKQGSYSGIIIVNSNAGTRYGAISMNVAAPSQTPNRLAPKINVSQNSFKLDARSAGEKRSQAFSISNVGGGTLEWNLDSKEPWIKLNRISGSNNESIFITLDSADLSPGNYNGTIMVTSNGGDELVKIEFYVPSPTPTLKLTPTQTTPTPPVLATITVSPATVVAGATKNFIPVPKDQSGNPMTVTVTWTSSDTGVGTIDSNGVFTAKTPGKSTITAASGAISGTATVTVTINMEFIQIPAGEFDMGSPSSDVNSEDRERPVHRVKFAKAFYLGKYEVTQKQWRDVMGTNPSYFTGDDLPVENVSWNDVQEFITKLNEKEGTTRYRLPSEAEWEYAVRSGTTTGYSFGDYSKLGSYAWHCTNSNSMTHPVGEKKPNAWGLYDMQGNAWEWVQDKWHIDYYGASTDGSAWESGYDSSRVVRGGSWDCIGAGDYRSAYRYLYGPGYRGGNLGFRLLRIS